jgi:5-methylcytosine-specific restriction enzyme subunit McrC
MLATTNWVGSFSIGYLCIDVIPKIDTEKPLAMKNLLQMVSAGGVEKFKHTDISCLAKTDTPLITAFLELYINNLRKEWIRGPIRRYVSEEANRFFLKGKIIFSRHLRQNVFHHERFFTASDEFTADNPVSRLLKAALNVCRAYPLAPHVSTQAKKLLCLFDEVSDERDAAKCLSEITIDRTTFRFQYLINLAKCVIERVSPWKQSLKVPVYSLMFDMNEVFEKFVAAELKRALTENGYKVITQSATRYLATRDDSPQLKPKRVFWLKPDISVFNPKVIQGRPACLVDTKWKMLRILENEEFRPNKSGDSREPVPQADMYQMYAYAHKYKCPVILIYPHHSGLPLQKQPLASPFLKYDCGDEEEPYTIVVCTVDITIDLVRARERESFRWSLLKLVQDIGQAPSRADESHV